MNKYEMKKIFVTNDIDKKRNVQKVQFIKQTAKQ